MPTLTDIKKQASILKEFLSQTSSAISHSSCLQALAKINGYKDWNTMSAHLNNEPPVKTNSFFGQTIQISEAVFTVFFNETICGIFSEDAYQVFNLILNNLKENSLVTKKISRKSLGKMWSSTRFDNALKQLKDTKFIHTSFDDDNSLIVTINPFFIWYGTPEKHAEAIELFDQSIAYVDSLTTQNLFSGNFSNANFVDKNENSDLASVIAFAEKRNLKNIYPKEKPLLQLDASVNIEEYPRLKILELFLKEQEPISDPRIYLNKVKEILGSEYYVGFGGGHIHIQSLDKKTELAFITAGV